MESNNSAQKRPSGRLKMHAWLIVVWILFWFWPGGLLWNSVEPKILGVPFNVVMWCLILPIIHIIHMVYCYRWRHAEDEEEARNLKNTP